MGRGDPQPERIIGRYAVFGEIAAGGMATVHLGRLIGPAGFARVVAIKRLHPQFAKDPEFVSMFLDEARLAARIRHPNVVSSLDVVALEGELFIVMDYVEGESVSRLRRVAADRGVRVPVPVSVAILVNALHGLHAAHETRSETGAPLGLIHRDVSPQNVIVGVDGIARVVDFGVAKATGRLQQTREGVVKGKIAYMAPEQLRRGSIDRRADVYAASIVLWELLAGERLFTGDNDFQVAEQILREGVQTPPSAQNPEVPRALDEVVLRGASRDPEQRFSSALELADALEHSAPLASPRTVGRCVEQLAAPELERRAAQIVRMEGASASSPSMAGFSAEHTAQSDISAPAGTLLDALPSGEPRAENAASAAATRAVPWRAVPPASRGAEASPPSAVSKVTWSAATPHTERRTALLVGIALGAVLAGVAVAIGIALSSRVQAPEEPAVLAVSSPVLAATPAPSPIPAPNVTAPTPAPIRAEPESPAAISTPKSVVQRPAVAVPRPPAQDPCDPPHYFEGRIKKYKPGCLSR